MYLPSRCHLFHQRCILLGDLVHLGDRVAHWLCTHRLFFAGQTDLSHGLGDAFDADEHDWSAPNSTVNPTAATDAGPKLK